jgi:transcription initiation factor TFIIA large subunit
MVSAANLYHSVINDVITSVRDSFLDEAVDENVLQELKTLWENKLTASKTIEPPTRSQEALLDARMASARMSDATRTHPGATAGSVVRQQPPVAAPSGVPQAASGNPQQLVITDPNRSVPVQITIPAQPGNPASQPRALTVQVPAHALQQQGPTSQLLQQVLTQAITTALNLPQDAAERHLQSQINNAFANR